MSSKRIRELLAELEKEIQSTQSVDAETRELLRDLDDDIERLTGDSDSSALDRAKELESRFAAEHPVAERIARELADIIAKMGI
jgi:DNA repair exonuclease SbcCD ATPase subunit